MIQSEAGTASGFDDQAYLDMGAIIALLSTAKDGRVSRISTVLEEGAGVVTSRADVHYVVTEFGVADLFGRSLRERAKALIGIAHPKFREELQAGAARRRLL